ncbi:MAG: competence/damage-inducible protein A [Alphaproteobacteria bacterium]
MTDGAKDGSTDTVKTAGILIIGDEVLSGRTQDTNISMIANELGALGIQVIEARVVPDVQDRIVEAVNALRASCTYVFTTGGIGPTHDDITADAIAAAFGVPIGERADAVALLEAHYPPGEFTAARRRMTRIPNGAELIDNPVSKAPGFQLGNVFVMAGVPAIAKAMMVSVVPRLVGGPKMESHTVGAHLAEGHLAEPLGAIQAQFPDVRIGSYPFYRNRQFGVSVVARATDPDMLEAAVSAIRQAIRDLGQEPIEDMG